MFVTGCFRLAQSESDAQINDWRRPRASESSAGKVARRPPLPGTTGRISRRAKLLAASAR